jgi:glycosyltransferase involved in cell wall biosynthesis
MRVSVIIPTVNRAKYLKNALISVQNQSFPIDEYEIIVVDNNSTDSTPQVVEECNRNGKKEVVYVKEPEPGLHNARHAGAKAAKGEILAYVDDDVICDSNWLFELVKPYVDPEVGCVGGKILPKWEAEPPKWINQYRSYLSLLDWGDEVKELEDTDIYGCNFSIRRSLLFEVGGFNPDAFGDWRYYWYRGDGESGLLRKVFKLNKKVIYVPKAIVWHVIPQSRLTLQYIKSRSAKQAISDMYTLYKNKKLSRSKLFLYSGLMGFRSIVHYFLAIENKIQMNEDYFHHELVFSYCLSQCKYALKLIYDNKLREFVKNENWIE